MLKQIEAKSKSVKFYFFISLLLILLLGFIIRVFPIIKWSYVPHVGPDITFHTFTALWIKEYGFAPFPVFSPWLAGHSPLGQPPLLHLTAVLASFFVKPFNASYVAVCIISLIGIVAIFLLVRKLFSTEIALIAAIVAAILPSNALGFINGFYQTFTGLNTLFLALLGITYYLLNPSKRNFVFSTLGNFVAIIGYTVNILVITLFFCFLSAFFVLKKDFKKPLHLFLSFVVALVLSSPHLWSFSENLAKIGIEGLKQKQYYFPFLEQIKILYFYDLQHLISIDPYRLLYDIRFFSLYLSTPFIRAIAWIGCILFIVSLFTRKKLEQREIISLSILLALSIFISVHFLNLDLGIWPWRWITYSIAFYILGFAVFSELVRILWLKTKFFTRVASVVSKYFALISLISVIILSIVVSVALIKYPFANPALTDDRAKALELLSSDKNLERKVLFVSPTDGINGWTLLSFHPSREAKLQEINELLQGNLGLLKNYHYIVVLMPRTYVKEAYKYKILLSALVERIKPLSSNVTLFVSSRWNTTTIIFTLRNSTSK